MTVLFGYAPPDGVEALIVWLSAIGETRANRPPGAVCPFYMVTKPAASDDKITEFGTYRVHSFGTATGGVSALTMASNAARAAHRRVLAMGPPFTSQQPITLANGRTVACDGVQTKLGPVWEKYSNDGSIERFIAEYQIDWRFAAV